MAPSLLQQLVWMDYRLAVLFTVSIPLLLLIWAAVQRNEAIQRQMLIYWKVASLLAITVLLMIAALPIGFLTGFLARILIPVSLWFWLDLNDEIDDLPRFRPLRLAFSSWRWGVSVYCGLGTLLTLPALRCGFLNHLGLLQDQTCRTWLNPPFGFRDLLLSSYKPGFVGFFGILGLVIYGLYLVNFLVARLPRQGRIALG